MLTQAETVKLLNRSLSTSEVTNFKTYLKIAKLRLEDLLCMNLYEDSEIRSFETREGYRTIFTDPFTGTPVVRVDGVLKTADEYSVRQFDNLNGEWFNSIVFKKHLLREAEVVSVEADWGFDTCAPADLKLLLAKLFDFNSQVDSGNIKSKKIEDYSVTYTDDSAFDGFIKSNQAIIDKYSICTNTIRQGDVSTIY